MAGEVYRSKQGDVIDQLCMQKYGDEFQLVNVLEINPGLADYPAVLPMGVEIYFPEFEKPSRLTREIRLWD